MTNVVGTIITDCADGSARTRQELRFNTLFGVKPTFLGVGSYSPIEAAGNLLEQLDVLTKFPLADKNRQNIVLVNVAPRAEDIKQKWDNGTPFCYFRIDNTLVVSTYEGHCLALVRDLGIAGEVELLDVPTVTAAAVTWGDLLAAEAKKINHSQFRSLEFLPLAAYWLWKGRSVPSKKRSLAELPSPHNQVWQIDNFDNVKTTLLPEDIDFEQGKQVVLHNGQEATCYRRLADVPNGVTALTIGSSGYGLHRFLEVVIGGCGKAASAHSFSIGSSILR
ncbi:MAG TPA: hypothetical protein VLA77_04125 [Candidatus Saccharimonadales bacterium]|nr:hypothetical protein [Candidatus Saccharimonadales bacterium]